MIPFVLRRLLQAVIVMVAVAFPADHGVRRDARLVPQLLAVFQLTLIMRLVRAQMLQVLRTDDSKFARARGLSSRTIRLGHALTDTLVPVMTIAALQLGGLIALAITPEIVFQWPGVDPLFIRTETLADLRAMPADLCLVALIFVAINLVVDLLYFPVDPRLRGSKSENH